MSTHRTEPAGPEPPRWFVGFDWGGERHRVALFDRDGKPIGHRDCAHAGAAYAELADWLRRATGAAADAIAVAIETTHGPAVDALIDGGFRVFAINPKQLDRFRDRYSPAGAKDDTRDADTLGRSLRTDPDAFRRLSPGDPLVVQLREATHAAAALVQERVRTTNRLRELLWRYYPQMLKLGDDLGDAWLLELWQQAPTPAKGARLHAQTVARILKSHRIRRLDAEQVRAILREAPLPASPGVTEAAVAHIRLLLPRIRLLNAQIKTVNATIDALLAQLGTAKAEDAEPGQPIEQRDVTILRSVPGIGRIVGATLLAEAGEAVQRRDYHALRCLSGQAPVTRRSGKTCLVQRRLACNRRLARAMYCWGLAAIACDEASRRRYAALRGRGGTHARALRGVVDRLLKLVCTLLQRRELFDPARAPKPVSA